jgi:hypothetical protein
MAPHDIPRASLPPHQPRAEAVLAVGVFLGPSAVHVAAVQAGELAAVHPVKVVREEDRVLEPGATQLTVSIVCVLYECLCPIL